MQEVAEFRGYAEDCRRIAQSMTNVDHKRRLLENLRARLPGTTLNDLRFRAGTWKNDTPTT